MRKFPCVFMRGGTSKGCMFLESDLPARDQWDDIFVQAMGSAGEGGYVELKVDVSYRSRPEWLEGDYDSWIAAWN